MAFYLFFVTLLGLHLPVHFTVLSLFDIFISTTVQSPRAWTLPINHTQQTPRINSLPCSQAWIFRLFYHSELCLKMFHQIFANPAGLTLSSWRAKNISTRNHLASFWTSPSNHPTVEPKCPGKENLLNSASACNVNAENHSLEVKEPFQNSFSWLTYFIKTFFQYTVQCLN